MSVRQAHLSAGCNRTVDAIDWGQNGCIAYAAHNAIVIYDVQAGRNVLSLLAHTAAVSCVKWVPADLTIAHLPACMHLLASGGADHTIAIWAVDTTPGRCSATLITQLGPAVANDSDSAAGESGAARSAVVPTPAAAVLSSSMTPALTTPIFPTMPTPSAATLGSLPSVPASMAMTIPGLPMPPISHTASTPVTALPMAPSLAVPPVTSLAPLANVTSLPLAPSAGVPAAPRAAVSLAAPPASKTAPAALSSRPTATPSMPVTASLKASAFGDEPSSGPAKALLSPSVMSSRHTFPRRTISAEMARLGTALSTPLLAPAGGHSGPVTGLACYPDPSSEAQLLLASVGGDARVCVWAADKKGAWDLQQCMEVPHGTIQNCVALSHVPGNPEWALMATGGVDNVVRIMVRPTGGAFYQACVLKGHDDWIRSLSIAHSRGTDGQHIAWLASASQDRLVRIWTITSQDASLPASSNTSGHSVDDAAFLTSFAHKPTFTVANATLVASISAVLTGHEDWVHSVRWQMGPLRPLSGWQACARPPRLLSAAMDRTLFMWEYDPDSGLWLCVESMGDAGADCLGYYTGVFSPSLDAVAANGFTGAIHMWRRAGGPVDGGAEPPVRRGGPMQPVPAACGHTGGVVDLCWDADGRCLFSASTDQTVRVTVRDLEGRWFEMARPQVHGHDFSAIAVLPQCREQLPTGSLDSLASSSNISSAPSLGAAVDGPSRFAYISASEEKVLRTFEAPTTFLQAYAAAIGQAPPLAGQVSAARGATAPALGLSNKAVLNDDDNLSSAAAPLAAGPDLAPAPEPAQITGQPLEEQLSQGTLWPETHKLYGHGNDVYSLAACPRGTCAVSAAKAQDAQTAAIKVWDTASGQFAERQTLQAHALTVTRMQFSRDGAFLLSVSRDRSFCVHQAQHHGKRGRVAPSFVLVMHVRKAHERVIWSGTWAPDSRLVATGSRDKSIRFWEFDPVRIRTPSAASLTLPALPAAVTSLAFSPRDRGPIAPYTLAVGFESGHLHIYAVSMAEGVQASQVWAADAAMRAAACVKCLAFSASKDDELLLAAGCSDHTVRVYAVAEDSLSEHVEAAEQPGDILQR